MLLSAALALGIGLMVGTRLRLAGLVVGGAVALATGPASLLADPAPDWGGAMARAAVALVIFNAATLAALLAGPPRRRRPDVGRSFRSLPALPADG
jgi:hypothetical protein